MTDFLTRDELWQELWKDFWSFLEYEKQSVTVKIAHYTSVESLIKIIEKNEIWFSNPYFMNDYQEVKFVMKKFHNLYKQKESTIHDSLKRETNAIQDKLGQMTAAFTELYLGKKMIDFSKGHLMVDRYIFCLSECDNQTLENGSLGMWRGYGKNGHGAAIVFDLKKIKGLSSSPFIIGKVKYKSEKEIEDIVLKFIDKFLVKINLLNNKINYTPEIIHAISEALYTQCLYFSFFYKNKEFSEEKEWRVVYYKEKDRTNEIKNMIDYHVVDGQICPKLKLKIQPINMATSSDFSLSKIIHKIIIGPSAKQNLINEQQKYLTLETIKNVMRKNNFKDIEIFFSEIPFRSANVI